MATLKSADSDQFPRVRLDRILIAAVWISTAVPKVFGPLREPILSHNVELLDTWLNIAFYIPLGVALSIHSRSRALATAAAVSVSAEVVQLFLPLRSSQIADVFANVIGAATGYVIGRFLGWTATSIRLSPVRSMAILAGVAAYLLGCPEVCSDVYSWRIGILQYRDVSVLGGGVLNGIIQILFIECHNGPVPNTLLVGLALAAAAVGLVSSQVSKGVLPLSLLGGLIAGVVVRFRPDTLGMTMVAGLCAGLVFLFCLDRESVGPLQQKKRGPEVSSPI